MSCQGNGIQCGTIQVLEPDSSVPVADAGGTADPSLVERGDYVLAQGETEVQIFFKTRKAAALYRFEYLYVDTADVIPVQPNPGTITCIPIVQTVDGFSLELAGSPILAGYTIRWRVVVVELTSLNLDEPESINIPIPLLASLMTVFLDSPRSAAYGFSELRVENLVDPAAGQAVIHVQVTTRASSFFVVAINPRPPTANYNLVARIP